MASSENNILGSRITSTLDGVPVGQLAVYEAEPVTRSLEDPSTPLTLETLNNYIATTLGEGTINKRGVSPQQSLRIDTVYACVNVIAKAVASCNCHLYRRRDDNGRERAVDHELYRLLRMRPSEDVAPSSFRFALVANLMLWGNAYAEVVRDRVGRVVELLPIESSRVRVTRDPKKGFELVYLVRQADGTELPFEARNILHFRNFTLDGVMGMSVIAMARSYLASAMSGSEFNEQFVRKGFRPAGVLKYPGKFKDSAAVARFRESVQKVYGGADNAGNVMVLEEGAEYSQLTMPMQDAQWVESQQLTVEQICRWFNVPPHKVGHLLRSTNNNIEHQGQEFRTDTVQPILISIEEEMTFKLLTLEEQADHYIEHDTHKIIAMDTRSQAEVHAIRLRNGIMTIDEVRAEINLNALPDGAGKSAWTQGANVPLPTAAELPAFKQRVYAGGRQPPASGDANAAS